ncbi:ImmA/IrrE family metallo-endopeptidase [Methanobrevibacter curvatus]|uniref:IrrE N-terminal-like domain-containing protein n=1 Tax=Methanobrevibacter curvatus TaxID=49547 RepID=A0A165ZSJ5_9EURY|nr:ImmA/IrrE family metallo-endopeptidase [Methanobrevibacter curvatus]KZX11104.1 hypothetical protein MBCUR_15390 [Methanobrevibacter curvatus]
MVYRVKVNPLMIKKAREEIGLSFYQLPQILKDAKEWEEGTKQPTWKDLRNLAKKYKRPPVFYLMSEPLKEEGEDIIEFRSPEKIEEYSYELNLEIRRVKYRRNIFLNLNTEMGNILPDFSRFVFKNKSSSKKPNYKEINYKDLGKHIRNFLEIPFETQKNWLKNDNDKPKYDHSMFLYQWKERLADLGVLVFETEKVSKSEMSGMSLYFDLCPIILLNGKDSYNRRIFTLIHELSHLVMRESTICDVDIHNSNETFCNKVAAEVLVPKDTLKNNIIFYNNGNINYSGLSNIYGVSQQVIAYRLANIGKIGQNEVKQKINEITEKNQIKEERQAQRNKKSNGGGMSKPAKKKKYEGQPYTRFILNAYENNLISSSRFMRYLDIPVDKIDKLHDVLYG